MPAPAKEGEKPQFTRSFINGIYEIGYVKEDGIWKMLSINWILPEDIAGPMLKGRSGAPGPQVTPDIPMDKNDLRYVTGYILPLHFTHPVTGKPSGEAKRNARLKPLKV